MRKVPLASAAAVLVLGLAGAVSISATSQAAGPSTAKSKTLIFHVVFSPFSLVEANTDSPEAPFALGDELTFHDQLFSRGQHVGDEGGSCVIVDSSQALASCTEEIRLSQGTITAQFLNAPPPHKQLAITGGTGAYDSAGGDGTLVEFGNGKGRLTLHVLSLVSRGGA